MAAKQYKLDLSRVLQAIDKGDLSFYSRLDEEEKKAYVPLVLMRYISLVTDQNKNSAYAILATNDLVNIGFWQLDKHKELQHMLLCLCGLGSKQYRPWLGYKSRKSKNKIFTFLLDLYPELKDDEIETIIQNLTDDSFKELVKNCGIDDQEIKVLLTEWKKKAK